MREFCGTKGEREMPSKRLVLMVLVVAVATPLQGATSDPATAALDKLGVEATRMAESDLCFPASAEEYEALGKHAIVRIEASSALSSELPLKSAYIEVKGLQIPLRRVATLEKTEDRNPATAKGTRYWRQVSFYLVPLNLVKENARLVVDFTGPRRGFGITTFTSGSDWPAFVRLDEYDTPSDPDGDAVTSLLAREYPDDFPAK